MLTTSGRLAKTVTVKYCHENLRLCEDHFEKQEFLNSSKKKLKKNALPSLFSVPNCPAQIGGRRKTVVRQLFVPKETKKMKSPKKSDRETPSKKKLIQITYKVRTLKNAIRKKDREIAQLKKRIEKSQKLEEVIKTLKLYLPPDEHHLIAMHLRMSVKRRKKFSDAYKTFAVAIYFKSPSCYRFLQTLFKLPAKATILRWMSKIQFHEGFCSNMFDVLKIRVERLKPMDRVCALMMDEISLKKQVDYSAVQDRVVGLKQENDQVKYQKGALLFLVNGLCSHWRQAFAYFFIEKAMTSGELLPLVKTAMDKLEEIGLHVKVISSDQGSNFCGLLSSLGVNKDFPHFVHNGKKVFCVADPPHLLKSTRNCLSKNKIVSSTGTAEWAPIQDLYETDRNKRIRQCPKLKKSHFDFKAFGMKMRVKWAAQILSHSVAAALFAGASFQKYGENAESTAIFAENMNNLFDSMNTLQKRGKTKYQNALTPKQNDATGEFLDEMYEWIQTWKIYNAKNEEITNTFRFNEGWLLNIRAVKALVLDLQENYEFEYLLTRRLCTDAVENVFSIVRSSRGFEQNPGVHGFSQCMKHVISN